MKQAFRLSCAVLASVFVLGAFTLTGAQTPSATPDALVAQLTSSTANTFLGDISGNGRFVVVESSGDIATARTSDRNNADGNREIFLIDYAQRRIFQITDTRSALKDATKPPVDPTKPNDFSNIVVEVTNTRPMISNDGRWIVFSSNASTPGKFDGNDATNRAALIADGNTEIFVYRVPQVADVSLSSGADSGAQDLSGGTFTRITDTPASRVPTAGTATSAPLVADDNRDATIVTADDGNPATLDQPIVAFVSTRDMATGRTTARNNSDANPEVFLYSGTSGNILQVTDSKGSLLFNENPALSDNGSVLTFVSNANLTSENNDDGKGNGNAEIYLARFNGSAITETRQVTHTKASNVSVPVNILTFGRRISRDGNFIAFESSTDNPKTGGTIADPNTLAVFVYNVSADSFTQVSPRAAVGSGGDVRRNPVFTDYGSGLTPARVVFVSALNFRPDMTFPAQGKESEGLDPTNQPQLFSAPVPFGTSSTLTRLTNNPIGAGFPSLLAVASNSVQRMAFSEGAVELGGGNADNSIEIFYLLTFPTIAEAASSVTLSYFTGATERPVVAASPAPSPSPSPDAVPGLAPGELAIVRSNTPLAPSNQLACPSASNTQCASEAGRRPSLPVELNGISVSIRGAAAGLYFVGNDPAQINFVVPPGLTAPATAGGTLPIVIFNSNTGTVIRGNIPIVPAQPDIASSTAGPGGRAAALNITNPCAAGTAEPFSVTTVRPKGGVCTATETETVPTVLEITLTGVRNAQTSQVKVTIGSTDIIGAATNSPITFTGTANATGAATPATDTPGIDHINVALPSSLAGAGDVPIVVSVTINGVTYTSRPKEDTPPRITINP